MKHNNSFVKSPLIFLLTLLFILMTGSSGWSLLRFSTILLRTADNHGRGLYRIEQDVVFSHGNKMVREIWTVENGYKMHLEVIGKKELDPLHLFFIYQDGKKYQVDASDVVISMPLGQDWLESYFHFRTSQEIRSLLLTQKIIPVEALKDPTPPKDIKDIKREPENFMRLYRVGGHVSYGIHLAHSDSPFPSSGLWIQQDQFHVQRVRLLSQVQVSAQKYKRFARRFWFPSRRTIHWDNHSVELKLVNVTPLKSNRHYRDQLNPNKMNQKKKKQTWVGDELIRDFYNRFR